MLLIKVQLQNPGVAVEKAQPDQRVQKEGLPDVPLVDATWAVEDGEVSLIELTAYWNQT